MCHASDCGMTLNAFRGSCTCLYMVIKFKLIAMRSDEVPVNSVTNAVGKMENMRILVGI